jgi:hypothetical protein
MAQVVAHWMGSRFDIAIIPECCENSKYGHA